MIESKIHQKHTTTSRIHIGRLYLSEREGKGKGKGEEKEVEVEIMEHKQQQARHRIQIHRVKPARSREYQNLRHVVPSLRRQRDVDKVEVVREAARYIDHLHKTLIERFVLCGIPDSLKGKSHHFHVSISVARWVGGGGEFSPCTTTGFCSFSGGQDVPAGGGPRAHLDRQLTSRLLSAHR